ncbi:MAG: aquaporin [Chitinophagaceae bacterium]|nr:aquaporin [Chitinophagaceae bacterium]
MKAAFTRNWNHYLQEALGLAIFMISACFFGALIFSEQSPLYRFFPSDFSRTILMGMMMGLTALFIFYSRVTSPSGSQINPAVTLTFLRLGKMCRYDALFFIIFQIAGGTLAVYMMRLVMGQLLTADPVHTVATVPGRYGVVPALVVELLIAFTTMSLVLFTSHHEKWNRYTRIFAACLVCTWVIVAGPISGFGMNPARSLASAITSGTWTSIWIYLLAPLTGMLLAAEIFLISANKGKKLKQMRKPIEGGDRTKCMEPLEFKL